MAAFTTIALGLAIAGMATKAVGDVKAGNAAKREGEAEQRAAESQAQLSEYNAAVADLQARDAVDRGELDASRFRSRTRQLVGEQRAGFASGGIDVGFGSAVDVQADATLLGEMDALTAVSNAKRAAWGFKVEGEDLRKQAEIQRQEGANAAAAGRARRTSAYIGMAGSLLGGASSLASAKFGFKGGSSMLDKLKREGIPYA